MKIAFIIDSFPTMSEKFIISQITGLLDCGHQVTIFPSSLSDQKTVHFEVEKYGLMERVSVPAKTQSSRLGRMLKAILLILMYLPLHPVLVIRSLKVFADKYTNRSLLGFINWVLPFINGDYDVIHCHFGPNGIRAICLKEIGLSCKMITTFHGYDVTTYIKENGEDVYSRLFEVCDLFTYNSESTKQKALALGCPAEKMEKLPMSINLGELKFNEKKPGPEGSIKVLSVGRLVEMKGREYAIRAMAQIVRNYPNVSYDIVGDGILHEQLQHLIDELGAGDSIHLLGWLTTEKLNELYSNSHILLHPSVVASNGNTEGQGVVLAEAQALGMPVVATIHGAFPESVLDGESGFLVPERNVDQLADRLEFLIQNPDKWPKMGRAGRKHVEEKFDSKMLNNRLLGIYGTLLR